MSQPAGASGKAAKKSKPANSKAAESSKSNRPPTRVTTVQKLHSRLQQVSISDQRGRADVARPANKLSDEEPPSEEGTSRDSSPGIDEIPPPSEPVIKSPPPPPPRKQEVKRTTAQILRELARCKSEQDAEVKRISALEFVASPEEALNKVSIETEELDSKQRAERRVLALLALDSAIASKQQHLQLKKKIAVEAQEEKRSLRRLVAELRNKEQAIGEHLREKVCLMRERARQAVADHLQQRTAQARIFSEETQALVKEAQRQKDEERSQRAALIQQIRQLESTPVPHFRELDLTATAGHGLLSEMSICELKERLAILKMQGSEDLKEKNQKIMEHRKSQEEQMQMAEKVLDRFHEIKERQRQQHKERANERRSPVTSERLQLLRQEFETKRAERLRKAARRRLMRMPQHYLLEPAPKPFLEETRSAPPGLVRLQQAEQRTGKRCSSDGCVKLTDQLTRLAEARPVKGHRSRFV